MRVASAKTSVSAPPYAGCGRWRRDRDDRKRCGGTWGSVRSNTNTETIAAEGWGAGETNALRWSPWGFQMAKNPKKKLARATMSGRLARPTCFFWKLATEKEVGQGHHTILLSLANLLANFSQGCDWQKIRRPKPSPAPAEVRRVHPNPTQNRSPCPCRGHKRDVGPADPLGSAQVSKWPKIQKRSCSANRAGDFFKIRPAVLHFLTKTHQEF